MRYDTTKESTLQAIGQILTARINSKLNGACSPFIYFNISSSIFCSMGKLLAREDHQCPVIGLGRQLGATAFFDKGQLPVKRQFS